MAAACRVRTSSGGAGRPAIAPAFLPGAGTRGTQQFEERGAPEEIEVACTRVGCFQEALACSSTSRPDAVEPRQPLLIERNRAHAQTHYTLQPPMEGSDYYKERDGIRTSRSVLVKWLKRNRIQPTQKARSPSCT